MFRIQKLSAQLCFGCCHVLKKTTKMRSNYVLCILLVLCLRPLEHWDRRFESCSGHGCVSVFLCVVLSCVGGGFALV
jgi:hypothetical protein